MTPNQDTVLDVQNSLCACNATFTVELTKADGVILTDTEKTNIIGAIKAYSVKNSVNTVLDSSLWSKTWKNNNIEICFKSLATDSTYLVTCVDIEGVNLAAALSQEFKTIYFKGRGTSDAPYQVENAAQLDLVKNYLDKYFKQTADIDLSGEGNWLPIGDNTNKFTGNYNGNGKRIKNLTIHSSDYMKYAGLFGVVSNNGNSDSGKIENLTIDGFSLRGSSEGTPLNANNVGLIACELESDCTISDCHLTDSRYNTATDSLSIISALESDGNVYVGGICVDNSGTISNCSVGKCQIKSFSADADIIGLGGICYRNGGSISQCCVDELIIDCSVTNSRLIIYIGGICANTYNSSSIQNCSVNNTSITGSKGNSGLLNLGGICSMNIGSISNSDVQNTSLKGTGSGAYVGGIIGKTGNNGDSITCCYVKDSVVESKGGNCCLGGIAGGSASITSCYIDNTTVKSNGNRCYIGGISGTRAAISKCYVTGSEITESSGNTNCQIGGISGCNTKDITSSYVINTNVKGSGQSGDYVGGICGYFAFYSGSGPVMSNCYVYEEGNYSISRLETIGGGLGYLVGLLYKYDSNPDSNAKVTDSFCNLTTSNGLSDLVNRVGEEYSPTDLPGDTAYLNEYIKNNYGGITDLSAFSDKTWSDGKAYTADDSVWKYYDFSSFPPTLKPN